MAIATKVRGAGERQAGVDAPAEIERAVAREGDARVARLLAPVLLALCALLPAFLAARRSYLGYSTETDFIGNYVLEAQRLLAGEALQVGFHPPLYAAVLGFVRSVLADWQNAGLAISVLSAAAAAAAVFWLVRRLFGPAAALGALVALIGSPVFLRHAAVAGPDVLFFALYVGCCALALAGIAGRRSSVWRTLGLAIGAALLTRTNAIPLLLLLAAPFVGQAPRRTALEDVVRIVAAAAIPIIAWFAYAIATGSPPLPTSNHVNLALTYFAAGADRTSADAYAAVSGRFDSTLDVLLHDPPHLIATYAADLLRLMDTGFAVLLAFPLFLLFLPGLLLLVVARGNDRVVLLFGLVFAAQLLMVNFKAFEPRYYLFLLPVLGAGLGVGVEAVLRAAAVTPCRRLSAASIIGAGVFTAVVLAMDEARSALHADEAELSTAVPAARRVVQSGDIVMARKPHLAFYTGARFVFLPDTGDPERLRAHLCAWSNAGTVHIFYGTIERERRPALHASLLGAASPPWLEVEAASRSPGDWALFRPTGCAPGTTGARRGVPLGPWIR